MKTTFSSKPFWMLAGMVFFLLLGILLGFPVGSYINIYYVYGGNSEAAGHVMFISGLVFNITCLIAVPIVASIGLRIGKERTMLVGMAIFTVAPFMSWFVFDPAHPYLQILFQLPVAMALSCVTVYAGAMVADLVDLDEFVTFKRREGSYAAMISFIFKLAGPLGNLGFAYLLEYWARFDETLDVQTPGTIFRMRLILMLVPLLPCAIAAVLAFLYPIRERQIREVRVLLEERRAKRLAEGRPPVASAEG
jgi:GPH family glycoside/pentoside/hexuronide:cation symporter